MADCMSPQNAAELVEQLRSEKHFVFGDYEGGFALPTQKELKAADAIEQLLAENAKLNTEIDLWRKREIGCGNCAHVKVSVQEYPCRDCSDYTHDKWEWLGVKEEEK